MRDSFSLSVNINALRPDFRVFATYFFGDDMYNYDSEGDSFQVTSKSWTELYMCSRENEALCFDIWKINDEPLVFKVTSQTKEIVNRIAYFLSRETDGEIIDDEGNVVSAENIIQGMGNFDLAQRLELADNSIWRKATEDNPFPNLNK